MKRLIKTIFWFLFIIIIIIVAPILYLYITISDSTDEAPIDLYNETITFDQEVTNLLNQALSDEKYYDFTLTENQINTLIFAIVRDSINKNYYNTGCSSDACKYIQVSTIDESAPIIGGKKVTLKHIYTKMTDQEMTLYAPINALGFKTNLNLGFEIKEAEGVYTIIIKRMGLGKLNLMKGIGKAIRRPILTALNFSDETVNTKLANKKLPITFKSEDFSFSFKKSDLGEIIVNLLSPDEEKPGNKIVKELFALLTIPEEGGLTFGFFPGDEVSFGAKINLEPFAADSAVFANLQASIKEPFDVNSFIKNKTQTFILNNLTGGEMKLVFTEGEFNRLLYDKTNGYEDFKYEIEFADGGAKFAIIVTGIVVEIESDQIIKFNFLVDINGLKSIMVLTGNIVPNVAEDEISIFLEETITIGTVHTSAGFMFDIIGDNIESFELMRYEAETRAFIITAETFNSFMGIGGEITPLTVERLKFTTGVLEVYVTVEDPTLAQTIDNVTDLLNDLLSGDFLDTDGFEGQDELVENLNNVLDDINQILNNPEGDLTPNETDQLIDIINQLSEENQQELYNQIEDSLSSSSELLDLYDLLFGK
ncbi:MAG: hypothetical protein M0R05_03810 [Bacilli bacterium]|nr:hypothetical protein [Bacilli bacterium]